jgi:hypothetical protein
MRKQSIGLDDEPIARPVRRAPRVVLAIVMATAAAPILYESALLCVANWQSALGRSSGVRTPVLDWTRDLLDRVTAEALGLVVPWFHHVPWQPSHVLLVASVAMTCSMLMLRR